MEVLKLWNGSAATKGRQISEAARRVREALNRGRRVVFVEDDRHDRPAGWDGYLGRPKGFKLAEAQAAGVFGDARVRRLTVYGKADSPFRGDGLYEIMPRTALAGTVPCAF